MPMALCLFLPIAMDFKDVFAWSIMWDHGSIVSGRVQIAHGWNLKCDIGLVFCFILLTQNQNQNDLFFKVNSYHLQLRKVIRLSNYLIIFQLLFVKKSSFTLSLKDIRLRFSQSRLIRLFKTVILLAMIFLPTILLEASTMWNNLSLALKFC